VAANFKQNFTRLFYVHTHQIAQLHSSYYFKIQSLGKFFWLVLKIHVYFAYLDARHTWRHLIGKQRRKSLATKSADILLLSTYLKLKQNISSFLIKPQNANGKSCLLCA